MQESERDHEQDTSAASKTIWTARRICPVIGDILQLILLTMRLRIWTRNNVAVFITRNASL